jgi:hypothetical protein
MQTAAGRAGYRLIYLVGQRRIVFVEPRLDVHAGSGASKYDVRHATS